MLLQEKANGRKNASGDGEGAAEGDRASSGGEGAGGHTSDDEGNEEEGGGVPGLSR